MSRRGVERNTERQGSAVGLPRGAPRARRGRAIHGLGASWRAGLYGPTTAFTAPWRSSSVVAPRPRATRAMAWSRLAASVCRCFSVVALYAWPRSAWTSRSEVPVKRLCPWSQCSCRCTGSSRGRSQPKQRRARGAHVRPRRRQRRFTRLDPRALAAGSPACPLTAAAGQLRPRPRRRAPLRPRKRDRASECRVDGAPTFKRIQPRDKLGVQEIVNDLGAGWVWCAEHLISTRRARRTRRRKRSE